MILGVDVGGTFTDAALLTGERLVVAKSPSTPADQSEGVMAAVSEALSEAGASAADVTRFVHGMTVGTNALLEGRVARTALLATEGFTDLEVLGRQARPELYRLCAGHPPPLASVRVAVPERTGPGRGAAAAGRGGAAGGSAGCGLRSGGGLPAVGIQASGPRAAGGIAGRGGAR